ncbi:MAG: flagellar filament capping protein FliD, partial [Longimicrobiales bacterium]
MATFSEVASFSGLASGIRWRDMIDQIIALESRPIIALEQKISLSESRVGAWDAYRAAVQTLNDAVLGLESGDALRVFKASTNVPAGVTSALASVSASATASPGSHLVDVLAVATGERLGSSVFASRSTALGLTGELRVNGKLIQITAGDTLDSIAQRFNTASGGTGGTGVSASILTLGTDQYRLVLTSKDTGAAGIDIVDGAAGVLQGLGFTDGTTTIKSATSNGALGDAFADSTSSVGSLLGFTSAGAGTVTIGGEAVAIDLASDTLDAIALAVNSAATTAGKGFRATVVDDTSSGSALKRLEISGTTSFVDSAHVLEELGIVEGGRGAIAQVVQGEPLTAGDATTPATAATALASLWSDGTAAGVQTGDTLTISGTRGDGSAFGFTYTVAAGDTLQSILDRLNDPVDGLAAGSRTATASVGADGSIVVTDDTGGASRLSLSIVAHNEGGGALDFGAFSTATAGLDREITAGADAELMIDGAYFTSASNSVTDTVPGLSLTVSAVTGTPVTVTVDRDVDTAAAAVKAVVDAYNSLSDYVTTQLTPPAEGGTPNPLYGNSVLRTMRSTLRLAFQGTIASDVANGLTRMQDLGVEIQKDGKFTLDEAKLKAAISADGDAVVRLLGLSGSADAASIQYLFAGDATKSGTYAVDITQAA